MAYDINSTLERLEQNLKDLDSARKQVESSVNASNNLQKVVGDYVSSVKALCERLQSWEKDLSDYDSSISSNLKSTLASLGSSCDAVVKSFNTKVDNSTNDFKTKTENTLAKFSTQNTALTEKVKELNAIGQAINTAADDIKAFKATLSQISKQISEAKNAEDAALKGLDNKVVAIQRSIDAQVSAVQQQITECHQDLVSQKGHLKLIIESSTDLIKGELSKIDALVHTTQRELEASIENTNHSVSVNRWIMVIGFIVVIALQLLYSWPFLFESF